MTTTMTMTTMARKAVWLGSILLGGCLSAGGDGFGSGAVDDDPDPILGDADSDADGDTTDDDPIDPPACPAYPEATGMRVGDIAQNISLPGNGPGDTWTMEDFWCQAHAAEDAATVLVMDIHSMTCGICLGQAAPELEVWQQQFAARGLRPVGVSINESLDSARGYWEGELAHTHPFMADQMFSTSQFFDGPSVGTPAYIVVELATMEIKTIQQGLSGNEEALFENLLRP